MRLSCKSHLLRYIKQEVIQFGLLGKAPAHLEAQIIEPFASEHWCRGKLKSHPFNLYAKNTSTCVCVCMYIYATVLYKMKSWICVLGINLSYLAAELKLWNTSKIFPKTHWKLLVVTLVHAVSKAVTECGYGMNISLSRPSDLLRMSNILFPFSLTTLLPLFSRLQSSI